MNGSKLLGQSTTTTMLMMKTMEMCESASNNEGEWKEAFEGRRKSEDFLLPKGPNWKKQPFWAVKRLKMGKGDHQWNFICWKMRKNNNV
jgi:hypothetical protein